MRNLVVASLLVIVGCNTIERSVIFRHHEPTSCKVKGFVSGTGKTDEGAYKSAKRKVAELGGNVIVPDPKGPIEIGFSHTPGASTKYYSIYNAKGFLCE
ncbi:hypothetical protein FIU95_06505 [Microbulbifer sp. THAF38]|nr:hypothetical protein FIU95_06505 [Microbulbifer sp. THAF38]